MKQLFTIDLKDYDPNGERFYRPSVRGIILNEAGEVAMIYSKKYHFYKFPGGGIEGDETHLEALAREIKEETGMTLLPDSVKEFGEVLRMQSGDDNTIFVQQNFYYTCKVADEIGEQELDDKEKEMEFVLKFVPAKEAIAANAAFKSDNPYRTQMAEHEKRVLEIIENTHNHQ